MDIMDATAPAPAPAASASAAAARYGEGAMVALVNKGRQDESMDGAAAANINLFDIRSQFLRERYQVVYHKLDVITERLRQCIKFTFKKSCSFVNHVDLIIDNAAAAPVNRILQRVVVECGGQRIDAIGGSDADIETHINTNCVLMNSGKKQKQQQRRIVHLGGKTYIPLVMAPFYDHNMAYVSVAFHEYCVYVTLTDDFMADFDMGKVKMELYGNAYFLDVPGIKRLREAHEFVTIQNQFCGAETMRPGQNSFDLPFNHPVYLIYFWGFDKSKVTNVKLTLNGSTFYDGSLDALEYYKKCRGFGDAEPCIIFFSQDEFGEPVRSSVNFSRMDKAHLVLTTTDNEECKVYIVGLNMQPLRSMSGMIGLAFSK